MKNLAASLLILGALLFALFTAKADSSNVNHDHSAVNELKLENLLTSPLERAEGIEVIVSRVSIPPRTELPKHWHPGEEFTYVIDGSVTLWQEGKADTTFKKGDTGRVSSKQIHTAITGDESVILLVFRVHPEGEPERVPVE